MSFVDMLMCLDSLLVKETSIYKFILIYNHNIFITFKIDYNDQTYTLLGTYYNIK